METSEALQGLVEVSSLYGESSPYTISQAANNIPTTGLVESSNFVIDTATPHGDVIINENCAIKPAVGWVTIHATEVLGPGIHEWSVKIENQGETSDGSGLMLGIVPKSFNRYDSFISQGGGWCISRAGKFYGNWKKCDNSSGTAALVFGTGDVVVFELDTESSRLTVSVGDRFVIGELSNLTSEVIPAISLHYKLQHVCFESRRTKVRNRVRQGWLERDQLLGADVFCQFTPAHMHARIMALMEQGLKANTQLERTAFAVLFHSRCYLLQHLYHHLRNRIEAEMFVVEQHLPISPATLREQLRCRYMPAVYTSMLEKQVSDAALHCGLQLFFGLVHSLGASNPTITNKLLGSIEQLVNPLPLFALSETSACRPAHLTDSVLDDIHTFLLSALNPLPAVPTDSHAQALKVLVQLAVSRGALRFVLGAIRLCLEMSRQPAGRKLRLLLQPLLHQLGQFRSFAELPPLAFTEDTGRWDIKPILHLPSGDSTDNREKISLLSMASDGKYMYFHTVDGLVKCGTGKHGTSMKVYATNSSFPYRSVTEVHSLAYAADRLWFRSSEFSQVPRLCLLQISTESLQIVGDVKIDGSGSVPSIDLSGTPFQSALPTTVGSGLSPREASTTPGHHSPPGATTPGAAVASAVTATVPSPATGKDRMTSDGRYLYLVSARDHLPRLPRRDSVVLPSHAGQLRPAEPANPVTIHQFDPVNHFRCTRTATLQNPRQSAAAAKAYVRQCIGFAKDTSIDLGEPDCLAIPSGFVTVEAWVKVLNKEETRVVYSHGDKANGGEVFIEVHHLENGYYWKAGARQDLRQGTSRSSAAMFTVSQSYVRVWLHVAVVYDGRWKLFLNGNQVAASKRDEPQVVVDNPKRKWLIGQNFVGMVCEVRVWKGNRSAVDIQRDMNRSLTGMEPGLTAYYRVNEGFGHIVYDWAGRNHGWISHAVHPSWRLCDVPIIMSTIDSAIAASTSGGFNGIASEQWPIFLPSVHSATFYTNGVEIAVLNRNADDTVGGSGSNGRPYGLLNFYSVETGRMLDKESLVSPFIDSCAVFDCDNSVVWYAANFAQSLCWVKSGNPFTTSNSVKGLEPDLMISNHPLPDLATTPVPIPLVALHLLASCDLLCRSYGSTPETLHLYKDMYLDVHQTTFEEIYQVLELNFNAIEEKIQQGKSTETRESEDIRRFEISQYAILVCVRLLRVNLEVYAQAQLDPRQLGLAVDLSTTDTIGAKLFDLLGRMMNAVCELTTEAFPAISEELAQLVPVGIPVFFPSVSARVMLLHQLLDGQKSAAAEKFHQTLAHGLLSHFKQLEHALAGIEVCLATHRPPPPLVPLSRIFTRSKPATTSGTSVSDVGKEQTDGVPSLPALLERLLTVSFRPAGAPLSRARTATLALGVLQAVQTCLVSLAGRQPHQQDVPLYSDALFHFAQRVFTHSRRALTQLLKPQAPAAELEGLQETLIGKLLPPLLNSLHACESDFRYLPELQTLSDNLRAVAALSPEATESERQYTTQPPVLPPDPPNSESGIQDGKGGPPVPWTSLTPQHMCALHWLHDLKASAEMLAAVMACRMIRSLDPEEAAQESSWLESLLLSGGYRDPPDLPSSGKAADATKRTNPHTINLGSPYSLLDDKICDQIALGQGEGLVILSAAFRSAKVEQLAGIGGEEVQAALRHLFAVFLKHSLTPVSTTVSANGSVDPTLTAKFKRIFALRDWLVELRDQELDAATTGSSSSSNPAAETPTLRLSHVIERCKFLLQFVPSVYSSEHKQVLKCLLTLPGMGGFRKNPATGSTGWRKMFQGWRSLKRLHRLLNISLGKAVAGRASSNADVALQSVLEFVKDPLPVTSLQAMLLARRARARVRCTGLEHMRRMLGTSAARKEILLLLVDAIGGHHYSERIQACGADLLHTTQSAIYAIIRELVSALQRGTPAISAPKRQQSTKSDLKGKGKEIEPLHHSSSGAALNTVSPSVAGRRSSSTAAGQIPPSQPQSLASRLEEECRYLTIKLLFVPWKDYDFAFLHSINLPGTLFSLCSIFDPVTSTELPETERSRKRRQQDNKDSSRGSSRREIEAMTAVADVTDAIRERAWIAVKMLAITCAQSLPRTENPGILKANSACMGQILDCACKELKLTLGALQADKSRRSREPQNLDSTLAEPPFDRERHSQQCYQFLCLVGAILQHPTPPLLDCVVKSPLLAILFACVTLAQQQRLPLASILLLSKVVIDLPPEIVDSALMPAHIAAPGMSRTGTPVRGMEDMQLAGQRTLRFLIDVAGGVLPLSATEPFSSPLALAALRLLRRMHLRSPNWQGLVNRFLAAQLSSFPAISPTVALYHESVRHYCIALHVVSGCTLDVLRPGSEAISHATQTQTQSPNAGTDEKVVAVDIDLLKGKAVCLSLEESTISQLAESRELSLDNLVVLPSDDADDIDETLFEPILYALHAVLAVLQLPGPTAAPLDDPFSIFSFSSPQQGMVLAYITRLLLAAFERYMHCPLSCRKLVEVSTASATVDGILAKITGLAVIQSPYTYSSAPLEETLTLLHSLLCSMQEPTDLTSTNTEERLRQQPQNSVEEAPKSRSTRGTNEAQRRRHEMATELSEFVGQAVDVCSKALELTRDDKDKAANLLMEALDEVMAAMESDTPTAANEDPVGAVLVNPGVRLSDQYALRFNRPSYVSVNAPSLLYRLASSRAFTVEICFRLKRFEACYSPVGPAGCLFFYGSSAFSVYLMLDSGAVVFGVRVSASAPPQECRFAISKESTGQWIHCVGTVDARWISLFPGGRPGERRAIAFDGAPAFPLQPPPVCCVGGQPVLQDSRYFDGTLVETRVQHSLSFVDVRALRLWCAALSPATASHLYLTSLSSQPASPLYTAPPAVVAGEQAEPAGFASVVEEPPQATLPVSPLGLSLPATVAVASAPAPSSPPYDSNRAVAAALGTTFSEQQPEALVLELLLTEGTGSSLRNTAPYSVEAEESITLHGEIQWLSTDLGPLSPEDDLQSLNDCAEPSPYLEEDLLRNATKPDKISETEYARSDWWGDCRAMVGSGYHALRKEMTATAVAAAIVYARMGLLALLGSAARSQTTFGQLSFSVPPYLLVTPHAPSLARTFTRLAQVRSHHVSAEDVDPLKAYITQHLLHPGAQAENQKSQAEGFIRDCMDLLAEPYDAYIYETPQHPYTSAPAVLQRVSIPGCSSYTISFDARCKTLDFLSFYADRALKQPLGKFPDSKGQWTGFTISVPAFYMRFSSENAGPSYWGYRFTVTVRSPRFEVTLDLLQTLLTHGQTLGSTLYNNATFTSLLRASHRETGTRRRRLFGLLTYLLQERSILRNYDRYDRPTLSSLLSLGKAMVHQFAKEYAAAPATSNDARFYSKYLQSLAELSIASKFALQQWHPDLPARERQALQHAQQMYAHPSYRRIESPDGQVRLDKLYESEAMIVKERGGPRGKGKFLAWSDRSWQSIRANVCVRKGKWYYEARVHGTGVVHIGWCTRRFRHSERTGVGDCPHSWAYDGSRLGKWHRGQRAEYGGPSKWKPKDVIGCMIDCDNHTMAFMHNGRYLGVAFTEFDPTQWYYPAASFGSVKEGGGCEFNFGACQFLYDPPPEMGYLALDAAHLTLPPLFPYPRLLAFTECATALIEGQPLPAFCARPYEALHNRAVREGPQVVEVVPLDGRPRIEDLEVVAASGFAVVRANAKVKRGKWYFEVLVRSDAVMQIGWCTDSFSPDSSRNKGLGEDENSWAYDGCRLQLRTNRSGRSWGKKPWKEGDIVGCLLDIDAGEMQFSLNGKILKDPEGGGSTAFTEFQHQANTGLYPAASLEAENACTFNFGASELVFKPDDYESIGLPSPLLQAIDRHYLSLGSEPEESNQPGVCNTFERDVRIVRYVSALCDIQRKTVDCVEVVENTALLEEFGLEALTSEVLQERVMQLKQFNLILRMVHRFVNLCVRPEFGVLISLMRRVRPLVFPTVSSDLLRGGLQLTTHAASTANGIQANAEHVKLTLNRRKASRYRQAPIALRDPLARDTIFGQVYFLLAAKPASFFRNSKRLWAVAFAGEGADDVGGPYRQCLADICTELMSDAAPLFIPTANQMHNIGEHRDRFLPNPSASQPVHLRMFQFIGRLMAGCLRGNEPLPLALSSIVWKAVLGESPTLDDLELLDKTLVQSLRFFVELDVHTVTEAGFSDIYDGTFVAHGTDGNEMELVPGGRQQKVTIANRMHFVRLVQEFRLHESRKQINAIASGFHSVIPPHLLGLLSWQQLEVLVCGRADFDVEVLRSMVRYEGLVPADPRVQYFWQVVSEFTSRDWRAFMRFVSGRERAPTRLKIMPLHPPSSSHPLSDDHYLPGASTCFFWISLPKYSSVDVMREKLLYAIHNCADIDADYRVRDFDDDAPATAGVTEGGNDDDEFEDYSHLL
eukprot:TRINITY_DN14699_c0_g1_i1.p1 TRINITY_DN14699_c0_g1~~TRINITY_DN14699_c0_g1_i1.p1  ORF type:complete len:4388 (+),score=508.78 TRINITY_DN14699_c0_g1_i1:36-13199(+)